MVDFTGNRMVRGNALSASESGGSNLSEHEVFDRGPV